MLFFDVSKLCNFLSSYVSITILNHWLKRLSGISWFGYCIIQCQSLQQSFEIFAFSLAGKWICVRVVITISPTAWWSIIIIVIAPVFELFFVMLQQHQRWKKCVTSTTSAKRYYQDWMNGKSESKCPMHTHSHIKSKWKWMTVMGSEKWK